MMTLQWMGEPALLAWACLLGLLFGSFLNVVIYRVPVMLERQWAAELAAVNAADSGAATAAEPERFNLLVPRSRCGHCGHAIPWYENIPVLSYLWLRGRCAACGKGISLRYPVVEVCCGLLAAWCVARFGPGASAVAWFGFSICLLALALIDWDTTLLPDSMTLPLLWAGLLASLLHWTTVPLPAAVIGAMAGYLSLWLVYWGFKLATGKEGMGFGDFKLFAALGAWFGWESLIPIILMASVIGAVIGIAMKLRSSLREGGYIPFGPFLAGAGLTTLVFGPQWLHRLLGF